MAVRQYKAAGGVVIDDGRMLLLDRPKRREVRLPKGHIDPGETVEQTALRETAEESGYADLEIVEDLGSQIVKFAFQGDDFVRTERYFLMRMVTHRTVPRNHKDEMQFAPIWVPLNEAVQQLSFEAEKQFAQRAIEIYQRRITENPSHAGQTE